MPYFPGMTRRSAALLLLLISWPLCGCGAANDSSTWEPGEKDKAGGGGEFSGASGASSEDGFSSGGTSESGGMSSKGGSVGSGGNAMGRGGTSAGAGGMASGGRGEFGAGGLGPGGTNSGGTSSGGSGGTNSGGSGGTNSGGTNSGGTNSGGTTGDGGAPQCDEHECRLSWPVRGAVAEDWIVSNYVDLQPGAGIRDYNGGAFTYEGHRGLDIALANFRTMDLGVSIYAVAPGRVTFVHDGEDDRNHIEDPGSCGLVANRVHIEHPDGRQGRYLHFRKNSILVEEGEMVDVGQPLGEIGSSGCSQSPHLHFELRESETEEVLDPFLEDAWVDAPAYDQSPGLLDFAVQAGQITNLEAAQRVQENATVISGAQPSFVIVTGGTRPEWEVEVRLETTVGAARTLLLHTFSGEETHYTSWWNQNLSTGTWTAQALIGGMDMGEPIVFRVE